MVKDGLANVWLSIVDLDFICEGTEMDYTRSIWRRIAAAVIDLCLAHIAVIVCFGWWAIDLDSPLRLDGSLLTYQICQDGHLTGSMDTSNWDKTRVCNTYSDILFPNREGVLQKISKTGNFSYIREFRFPMNSRDKATSVIKLDNLLFLFWWLGASIFEASAKRSTPGKRVFGLEVEDDHQNQISLAKALIRNGLKMCFFLALLAFGLADDIYLRGEWMKALETHGQWPELPGWSNVLRWAIYSGMGLTNAFLVFSFIWPWKNMGRALYDRIAGTLVKFP